MRFIPLNQRVTSAFDQATIAACGAQYLDALLHNWRELAKALRRSLLLVVALMIAFVLLRGAKHASFDLGPLKLTDISAVLTIVPVLVVVLIYECTSIIMAYSMYREAIGYLISVMHPSIYENDLELLLVPPTISLVGSVGSSWEHLRADRPGAAERFLNLTSMAIFYSLLLVTLAFLVYAYVYLYTSTNTNVVGVSISLAASLLYAAREFALFVNYQDEL